MNEVGELIATISRLTTVLTVLVGVLIALVLIDCAFLYRRMVLFRKKQEARRVPCQPIAPRP